MLLAKPEPLQQVLKSTIGANLIQGGIYIEEVHVGVVLPHIVSVTVPVNVLETAKADPTMESAAMIVKIALGDVLKVMTPSTHP